MHVVHGLSVHEICFILLTVNTAARLLGMTLLAIQHITSGDCLRQFVQRLCINN